jgi:hypothetical protein
MRDYALALVVLSFLSLSCSSQSVRVSAYQAELLACVEKTPKTGDASADWYKYEACKLDVKLRYGKDAGQ